jgi:hypothetical protein
MDEPETRQNLDTCRVYDIAGIPVRVHGSTSEPLTEEDRAAFRALIEACRRRYARDRGWQTLTVDLSNTSAFVTDLDGNTLVAWSGVTRRTALLRAESAGWVPTTKWEHTTPPDGFWCYVNRAREAT